MKKSLHILALLLFTQFTAYASAREPSPTITIGDQQIALPNPHGQVPLQNKSSFGYQAAALGQARLNNILLASYRTPEDAAALDSGARFMSNEWAIAYVTKAEAIRRTTSYDFAQQRDQLVQFLEKETGLERLVDKANVATNEALTTLLKERDIDPNSAKVKVGKMYPLGIYAKTDSKLIFGALTAISVAGADFSVDKPVVMVLCFVHARDRVFWVSTYKILANPEDLEYAKGMALGWADSIVEANRK